MENMSDDDKSSTKRGVFESPYVVMVTLALGTFMMGLDSYIFSPSIVTIVHDLNTSYNWVTWTIMTYLIVATVLMPLMGKLADIYGRKRMFVLGVGIFTIGSFACSLSWNILALLVFRGVQAAGGSMIVPAAFAAMSSAAPENKQGRTMGVLWAVTMIGPIIGPNIGGYVVQTFGWRFIFYINIPIGITAIILAHAIHESHGTAKHHIDAIGALLLGGSLVALLLGIINLETVALTDVRVFPLFIVAGILLVAFVIYEKRASEPIINMAVISRGDILAFNLAMMTTIMGMTCIALFVPSFGQLVLKLSVQDSGTILTAYTGTIFVMSLVGGMLIDKLGAKPLMLAGLATSCFAFIGLALFGSNLLFLILLLIIAALGWGVVTNGFQVTILGITPKSEKGSSSAILNTFRGIGGVFTPLIGGYFLSRQSSNVAFHSIFWTAAILLVISIALVAYALVINRNAKISRQRNV
jgi:EmrB/QacA subfamily drug resistance transporter